MYSLPSTGGCACGAIRFEVTAAPLMMLNCHCDVCQKLSGGPYVPVVLVPRDALRITKGEPRYHASPGLKGPHTRGFCAECGSRLFGAVNPARPFVGITASAFDERGWFSPAMDIFAEDAQTWDALSPLIPQHPGYPPG